VTVYFEWDGPVGRHQFEALWKNPEGKVVAISEFKYEATQKRFGGYWTLLLSESLPTGVWTLEARVDGEVTGVHTFQVVSAPRPAEAAPTRRVLSPAEIYQRALAASVSIEKLSLTGDRFGIGSGFFAGDGLVLTAFQVIDGASRLRIRFPDSRPIETNQVMAWNRRQDWVLLKVDAAGPSLMRAEPNSWAVGDRCYSLDFPVEGNRVIVDADIIGRNTFPRAGERLNLSFFPTRQAIGAPVLNEYAEVIGVVGGELLPGSSTLEGMGFRYDLSIFSLGRTMRGTLAVPITLVIVPSSDARPTTLDDLAKGGQFVPPLVGHANVTNGALARNVDRKGPIPQAVDAKSEFSRRDGTMSVLLTWNPQEKRKAFAYLRVYDLDNRLLFESKPLKISLRPNQILYSSWDLTLGNLPAGIYRIDVYLDADPVWRTFFRLID
jgi:S1-C subfamily serine protease